MKVFITKLCIKLCVCVCVCVCVQWNTLELGSNESAEISGRCWLDGAGHGEGCRVHIEDAVSMSVLCVNAHV